MGVQLNFVKSEGIRIICPEGLQAEFKAKSSVSFVGYNIGPKIISMRRSTLKRAQDWMSYLIYSNLLQEPKRGKLLKARLVNGIDQDYRILLIQLRRYLYGELSESQLRKYVARQTPLMRYHGLMSFYPIVNDEALLKELDGWLLNSVHRALRLRAKLFRKAGIAILPPPHDQPKANLLTGCGKIVLSDRFLPSLRRFVSLERLFAEIVRVVGVPRVRFRAVRRHYDPDSLRGNGSGHQVSHAHEIVGRTGEGKHPIHLQRSAVPHLAE